MDQLLKGHCAPCEGGTQPLSLKEVDDYNSVLTTKWQIDSNKEISQQFEFKDFDEAMKFVNKVAGLANEEGHHPDIYIYYNKVKITLTTHAIGGLSVNDFIMARKIEAILKH